MFFWDYKCSLFTKSDTVPQSLRTLGYKSLGTSLSSTPALTIKLFYYLFPLQLSARLLNWLFCGPCIQFLKTSTTFHKMTLTGVTLLVTSLLVASPILFLISAAPSMPYREGCAQEDCIANLPPPECQEQICKNVAASIQSMVNWKADLCKDFKSFSCSTQQSFRVMRSPQEITDHQMLRKSSFMIVAALIFQVITVNLSL